MLVAVVVAAESSAAIPQRLRLQVQVHRADHLRWETLMVVSPPHLRSTPTPVCLMTLTLTLQVATMVWRIMMAALGMHHQHRVNWLAPSAAVMCTATPLLNPSNFPAHTTQIYSPNYIMQTIPPPAGTTLKGRMALRCEH